MLLILTDAGDKLQQHVIPALERKGARFVRFNTAEFPQKVGTTIRYNDRGKDELSLCIDGKMVNLEEVETVWYRRPLSPMPASSLSADDQVFVRRESEHVLGGLWGILRDRFWINPYDKSRAAEHKPYQLQIARAVGFDVPRTLITNDPDDALGFFERCHGQVVYKCLSSYARMEGQKSRAIFTSRVERQAFETQLEEVRLAPCIFQEYVPKKCELRVTVMGRKIFTSEIDSQYSQFTKDDWRRHALVEHAPNRASDLPDIVKAKVREMLGRMGLVFGCFDFIVTPDGRAVFIELNPNGQWHWVENETGMPLVDNFSEMLIQGTPEYSDPISPLLHASEQFV